MKISALLFILLFSVTAACTTNQFIDCFITWSFQTICGCSACLPCDTYTEIPCTGLTKSPSDRTCAIITSTTSSLTSTFTSTPTSTLTSTLTSTFASTPTSTPTSTSTSDEKIITEFSSDDKVSKNATSIYYIVIISALVIAIIIIIVFVKKKSHTKKLDTVQKSEENFFYENPVACDDNYFVDPIYETIDDIIILENSHYEA